MPRVPGASRLGEEVQPKCGPLAVSTRRKMQALRALSTCRKNGKGARFRKIKTLGVESTGVSPPSMLVELGDGQLSSDQH